MEIETIEQINEMNKPPAVALAEAWGISSDGTADEVRARLVAYHPTRKAQIAAVNRANAVGVRTLPVGRNKATKQIADLVDSHKAEIAKLKTDHKIALDGQTAWFDETLTGAVAEAVEEATSDLSSRLDVAERSLLVKLSQLAEIKANGGLHLPRPSASSAGSRVTSVPALQPQGAGPSRAPRPPRGAAGARVRAPDGAEPVDTANHHVPSGAEPTTTARHHVPGHDPAVPLPNVRRVGETQIRFPDGMSSAEVDASSSASPIAFETAAPSEPQTADTATADAAALAAMTAALRRSALAASTPAERQRIMQQITDLTLTLA